MQQQRTPPPPAEQSIYELRRPGILKICEELKREHPDWSDDRIHREAKEVWTLRQR